MAAIVNLFATMTSSISSRRAVIELNSQLRQVRQRLALDLAGCTVPPGDQGLMPWRQRPGEAIGYFEIVEGEQSDADPSDLLDDDNPTDGYPDGIDVTTSIIPGSQVLDPDSDWVTDARALGDYDDVPRSPSEASTRHSREIINFQASILVSNRKQAFPIRPNRRIGEPFRSNRIWQRSSGTPSKRSPMIHCRP
jgi:hypothetical protein